MKLSLGKVTREQIRNYAECSGDDNRIHLDDDFAKAAGLPSIIAHGMLTMGLAGVALEKWGYDLNQIRHFESKFKDKVFVNEELFAELQKKEEAADGSIQLQLSIVKADDSEVLQATAKLADFT
jgi:acyl dehydratase